MSEPSFDDSTVPSEQPSTPSDLAPDAFASGPVPPERPRWRGRLNTLWTLIVRLLLLGVGMGGGWVVGLLVAEFFPAQSQTPPLQEQVQRGVSQTARKLQQLPQWWRGEETVAVTPIPPPPQRPVNLSDAETQLVASELSAMQAELDALGNRLGDLEQKLGRQPSTAPPAVRLRRLEQALSGTPAPAPTPRQTDTPTVEAATPPASRLIQDRVTLPSAVLFTPDQAELTLGGEQILETILSDLARYPAATIVVGGHGRVATSAAENLDLTFAQALAVQRYLESRLGDRYHWIAVGYGDTRPLTTETASERNQRVEIAIVPAQ